MIDNPETNVNVPDKAASTVLKQDPDSCVYVGIDSDEQMNSEPAPVNTVPDGPFQRSPQSLKNDTGCVDRVRKVTYSDSLSAKLPASSLE
ncbi:unnamed protein product [Gongylonema pulchrum]|uniref:Uncharacterized protein n=1 Tax=Gongylonema pulchrum TaxID=637853 RepID=A0A183E5F3_9BILA|nr:unnamed protein product [Gongylonema pulchrum]